MDPVALNPVIVAASVVTLFVIAVVGALLLPFLAFVRDRERFEAVVDKLRLRGTPDGPGTEPDDPVPGPPPPTARQLPPATTRRARAVDDDRWGPVVPVSSLGHDGPADVRVPPTTPLPPQPTPPEARHAARTVWGAGSDDPPPPPYTRAPDKPGEITTQFAPIRDALNTELHRWQRPDWLSTVPDPPDDTVVPFTAATGRRRRRRTNRPTTQPPGNFEDTEGGDAS